MKTALLLTTALTLSLPALAISPPTPDPATATAATTTNPLLALRGLNGGVQDALTAFPNIPKQFPGMNALRLNTGGQDSAGDIATVVREYTGIGVMVEIEDHSGNQNNVAWYQQMASMFKGNPLVLLELPNEPNANNLVNIQVSLIRAIRAAGYTNPIGIQPAGGWDFSNVGPVIATVGATGMYVTPHLYCGGNGPDCPVQYVNAVVATAKSLGLPIVIDEFGNAIDGMTMDPDGAGMILAVLAANEGKNGGVVTAGAIFWAMNNGNHPDGADSACLTPDCSQLTVVGRDAIQPWLWNKGPAPTVTAATQATEIADLTQQANKQEQNNETLQNDMTQTATNPPSGPAPVQVASNPPNVSAPPTDQAPSPSLPTSAPTPTVGSIDAQTIEQIEKTIQTALARIGISATFAPIPTTDPTTTSPLSTPLGGPTAFPPQIVAELEQAKTQLLAAVNKIEALQAQIAAMQTAGLQAPPPQAITATPVAAQAPVVVAAQPASQPTLTQPLTGNTDSGGGNGGNSSEGASGGGESDGGEE